MNNIAKDIFKSIHEGKWMTIEYKNKGDNLTSYWIMIKSINIREKSLIVEGLHLSQYVTCGLKIFIDSIQSSKIIDGSYYKINQELVNDIKQNPEKYSSVFNNVANLKVLNYLMDCHKLDCTPYKCEYSLIKYFDGDRLVAGSFTLSDTQFKEVVKNFQIKVSSPSGQLRIKQLCLNVLSINTKKGLYVLAYRRLKLDVMSKTLVPDEDITVCKEYTIDGYKQSIRQFLDADDYSLIDDFKRNMELIKDKITYNNPQLNSVDDMPYMIAIGMDNLIDLDYEYKAIMKMYNSDNITYPIRAFFGDLVRRPDRRKEYPVVLLNKRVNIDQLLVLYKALKYPLTYVQGPPGTGKTNTINNTIMTAFFNQKTVLLTSYNNHPIDNAFQDFMKMSYKDRTIPFPIIRLGNNDKVREAITYIKQIYERTKNINIYEKTLEKNKEEKIEKTKKLNELLKRHETILDLKERKETIEKLLVSYKHLKFQVDLQGRQLEEIKRELKNTKEVTDDEVLSLLNDDEEGFRKYLYYTSARYIKRLDEPKYSDLMGIIKMKADEEQIQKFNKYLSNDENMKKLLRIFPIVLTTCISAHKLGEPKQYFDMVLFDEASQCNTAISLVPIIRGDSLMLVGDPQQLNPVVLLDTKDNLILKRKYAVADEYDYIENSIYKTYLACDSVSDEILLRYHYRSHKKIIDFNNRKYYNEKLKIMSNSQEKQPLTFVDIEDNKTGYKNTSPVEAERIIEYAKLNKDKSIGIITPFVNQKQHINKLLEENGLNNVNCGTVHAFQGDQKDVIMFSLAITDQTHQGTYDWLKSNKELINVATSRARDQLIILSSSKNLDRLSSKDSDDDLYELVECTKTNGVSTVSKKSSVSRALGIKPYSTKTEDSFLTSLSFALDNILYNNKKCTIHKEVPISHVFTQNISYEGLFYTGRFDFVVYEKRNDKLEYAILAIELDGKEHMDDELVMARDRKKNEICRRHGLELIRIENSYARRYNYIKEILTSFFGRINAYRA